MNIETAEELHPAPNFDRLARLYRWMEWASFGPFLAACRYTYLPNMRNCRNALVIGDGDGRFTARLLRTNPQIRIDTVDASPAMLQALKRQAGGNSSRLQTQCLDAREWQPSGANYDLIVTHFFLDCLTTEEVHVLAGRVRSAAKLGAIWVISEFAIPENPFGSLVAAPIIDSLYSAFSWITGLAVRRLPDHSVALRSAGFAQIGVKPLLAGLLSGELWARES